MLCSDSAEGKKSVNREHLKLDMPRFCEASEPTPTVACDSLLTVLSRRAAMLPCLGGAATPCGAVLSSTRLTTSTGSRWDMCAADSAAAAAKPWMLSDAGSAGSPGAGAGAGAGASKVGTAGSIFVDR